MTTLAAIELQDGSILIGSDSQAGNCHSLSEEIGQYDPVEKWIQWPNGWFLGLSGFLAICQDLRERSSSEIDLDDSIGSVRTGIKGAFAALYGDPVKTDGIPEYKHSSLLAARAGTGVFTICHLLSAIKIKRGRLVAEGHGRDFAYGAFLIAQPAAGTAIAFHESLAVAAELDASSGPPILMKELLVGEPAQDLHPPPRVADLAPKDHPALTNGSDLPQRTIKDAHQGVNSVTKAIEEIQRDAQHTAIGSYSTKSVEANG